MASCRGAWVFRNEVRAGGGCREVSQTGCTGELRIITIVGTRTPFAWDIEAYDLGQTEQGRAARR